MRLTIIGNIKRESIRELKYRPETGAVGDDSGKGTAN